MLEPAFSSSAAWYDEGGEANFVRTRKSSGGLLGMFELERPGGHYPQPALPDLRLLQSLKSGPRIHGDAGWGRFDVVTEEGCFFLGAPNSTNDITIEGRSRTRCLSLPLAQWQETLEHSSDGECLIENLRYPGQGFRSPAIHSALRTLWALSEDEGPPSRLLARAAGCEILAALYQMTGKPFTLAKGGLAPGAERRCRELMRARMAEDISLDELAAEAGLSPFHFARMFKQSVGVPPRVYLTQLRMEKACELLEQTDLPITEIAFEVGYSTNQVLARVFTKHQRMSPTDYRRAIRK